LNVALPTPWRRIALLLISLVSRDEDLFGAAGQPGHDPGDPVGWRGAVAHRRLARRLSVPADDKDKGKEISLLATFNV
jgi:hypothetical protein